MGRRRPSTHQGESPQEKPTLPTPGSWTSSLHNCERMNVCGLSHRVRDALLRHPKPSTTAPMWWAWNPVVSSLPSEMGGRVRWGEKQPGMASWGRFPSESPQPPTPFPNRIPRKQNAEAEIYRGGFISRQRKTEAISPDTNIDEYVYRNPQTGKLKCGWSWRASRTPVMDLPS